MKKKTYDKIMKANEEVLLVSDLERSYNRYNDFHFGPLNDPPWKTIATDYCGEALEIINLCRGRVLIYLKRAALHLTLKA